MYFCITMQNRCIRCNNGGDRFDCIQVLCMMGVWGLSCKENRFFFAAPLHLQGTSPLGANKDMFCCILSSPSPTCKLYVLKHRQGSQLQKVRRQGVQLPRRALWLRLGDALRQESVQHRLGADHRHQDPRVHGRDRPTDGAQRQRPPQAEPPLQLQWVELYQ